MSVGATDSDQRSAGRDAVLRETVETLAPIERPPCSRGERIAAHWIAERLRRAGCEARVEEERAYASWPRPVAALTAVGLTAGLAAGRRGRGWTTRLLAGIAAAAAAAGIAEDASNGPRLFRRLTMRKRPTWNVVAETGDRGAARTMVVLAHHDAPQTGFIFSQSPQRWVYERYPDLIERTDTSVPLWWSVAGGPAVSALGALSGSRPLARAGALLSAGSTISVADIARSRVVPGANDNLSGVAVLVALAEALRGTPVEGLRVLLVSCGSEEVLQGGIYGFAERHFPALPPESTWVLNHDSVGSPRLALLEGEGPFVMEDFDPDFKDLVGEAAAESGIELRRGLRARLSTDSVIPHRAGYPVASFVSINAWKSVSNYHWPTDVPENLDYSTVNDATELTLRIAERLAGS
ncbi:MAG: M28 family metallopeptidase [Solirubrobacterales bacterium]